MQSLHLASKTMIKNTTLDIKQLYVSCVIYIGVLVLTLLNDCHVSSLLVEAEDLLPGPDTPGSE